MQIISESETSENVCQDSYLLVDTSLMDIPYTIFDTSTFAVSVTKSCAISFYAFCFNFSSYKACSFWNSDILQAIVERVMIHDTIEYWISSSSHKILIYMVPILLSSLFFFLSERGTPVCSWPSSKLAFERFILQ